MILKYYKFLILIFLIYLVPLGAEDIATANQNFAISDFANTGSILGGLGGMFFYVKKWFTKIETILTASQEIYTESQKDYAEVKQLLQGMKK